MSPRRAAAARALVASLAAATLTTAATASATASPLDLFGFGSHHSGRAGAVSAVVDDFAAGYYDPAGLAFATTARVTFGVVGSVSNLRANDTRMPMSEPVGFVLGASTPVPLGGVLAGRFAVGLGLYALPRTLVRVRSRLADEVFFPYYDNRAERMVVLPAIAIRVADQLSVGLAINYLATLTGQVRATEGPRRSLDARVDEQLPSIVRINAGIRWRARADLDVALVYRQRFEIPFRTVADTQIAGQPIDLTVSSSALYTPHQLVAGIGYRRGPAELTVDLGWSRWSDYPGPFVAVSSQLPLLDPFDGTLPDVPYRDTVTARFGGQISLTRWVLRAGYAFETSPFPAAQPGITNLLDGPKHTVALGTGVQLGRVRVDVHATAQVLGARTITKTILADDDAAASAGSFDGLRDRDDTVAGIQITNPGYPTLRSGGQVLSAGATMEVAF